MSNNEDWDAHCLNAYWQVLVDTVLQKYLLDRKKPISFNCRQATQTIKSL